MLDLFHFLLGSILAPLLVNVVSYVLERLFDKRLGNGLVIAKGVKIIDWALKDITSVTSLSQYI
ncbi:hypothetical protein [Lactobacillus crispatus]|uniref:hypothetical protein n=1 Tax=Lactobacillus crispatus TaxID=47770 RepID=UPI0029C1636D|nr:hypothetical protein [Lactobacillus crispatus]MDX5113766.1 hypothetical protein [Lactobacillus crispatus]MDX5120938.1 hypothetical protein [Lactobacillus crispatus]MDX5126717.1 hypothetical protein [Lactobacillus crispatus]MDX5135017.1 hypothetical protein [Lactobacillus crispatus]